MKRKVFPSVTLALLMVFAWAVLPTHADMARPGYSVNCADLGGCSASNYWGNNPNDPSYGDAGYLPGAQCGQGGCFVRSDAYASYNMPGCAKVASSPPFECLTGIEVGNFQASSNTNIYCGYLGAGIYWYVIVRDVNARIVATTCAQQDSGNANHSYQVKISRYFSNGGGYNVWILGTHNGSPVCNPCGYPFSVYNEPLTLYYTSLEMSYYDNGTALVPVKTISWTNNQFQKTDGTWHYQTVDGTMESFGGFAEQWWHVHPANSSTGGDLNGCVDANFGHPDCANV